MILMVPLYKCSDIEVEFRTEGSLKERILEIFRNVKLHEPIHIIDSYIAYNSDTGFLHRLRAVNDEGIKSYWEMQKIPSQKKGHLYEPPPSRLSEREYQRRIDSTSFVVTVEGIREEIKYENISFCLDDIKDLGKWTEFEKLIKSENEITKTERELIGIAKELGINKNKLTITPYPQMLMARQNGKTNYH